jgi:restriction endonuclease S subunit
MKKPIKDITDIQLGYQFRKKIEPVDVGTHQVIQIRDFDDEQVLHTEDLYAVNLDKKAERFLLKKGDVLFLARGHKNWAAAISEELDNTVAVSHFFILRIKTENLMPEYLAWYINQTKAQEYLHNVARRGSHMPLVTKSGFESLEIDIPDMSAQSRIVELNRLLIKERVLSNKLQKQRELYINHICLKASKTD